MSIKKSYICTKNGICNIIHHVFVISCHFITYFTLQTVSAWCQPEQVHISYGNTISEMVVMWATGAPCDTIVHYAPHPWNLNLLAVGQHVELGHALNKTFRFLHRTVLKVSRRVFMTFIDLYMCRCLTSKISLQLKIRNI